MSLSGLLVDLNVLVKEQKDISLFWKEAIRNVYGIYIDEINVAELDGTVQQILYKKLEEAGLTQSEVDAKMELFINESPYVYVNVAGHDNMNLTEGAKEILGTFCKDKEFVVGLATPVLERSALNMFERAKIDSKLFRFTEYGGYKRDANSIIVSAIDDARKEGAEQMVLVTNSQSMINAAKVPGIKTVAVTSGTYTGASVTIKSLKDIKKAVSKALR